MRINEFYVIIHISFTSKSEPIFREHKISSKFVISAFRIRRAFSPLAGYDILQVLKKR